MLLVIVLEEQCFSYRRKRMTGRVVLNIRGVNYETYEETLSRFPNTLLGNSTLRKTYWNNRNREYYFDRNNHAFDAILFFYQSGGIIAKPECIDDDEFQEELHFFGIIKEKPSRVMMNDEFWQWRTRLWLLTNHKTTSVWSKLFALFSTIMIISSTITYCLETSLTDERDKKNSHQRMEMNKQDQSGISRVMNDYFFIFETIYVTWFALEYILRIASHPRRVSYMFSLLGFVDFIAIVPYFILASRTMSHFNVVIRIVKFLQILRILKISRYNKSLQLLGKSLNYCKGQISLLLIFFFINCLACGSVLYWVERSIDSRSNTGLMDTIWFCIISMTTVGYGDIVPKTSLGKLVAAITILVGIIILFHIFIPVYLSYFALLYEISILKALETSEKEREESQEPDDYSVHRRKSISSSVRKSYASVGRASICFHDTIARKQSMNFTEDTVMRKFKYDYLRKISSIESSTTASQKSLEMCETPGPYMKKITPEGNGNAKIAISENVQTTSNLDSCRSAIESTMKVKGRKKAVYEQPTFLQRPVQEVDRKRSYSFSTVKGSEEDNAFRKFSLHDKKITNFS